ncbi:MULTISPECIES: histidine kinase [unclassified Streptomyces]|uniref:sensor histidine kinase n=1 Tax=unclassified Streptomyces TaxID=2593676 RepID=UPI00225BC568|nr:MULTISPECIES: histidine kinase [unclassified Streptomyces]MCX4527209.1 histidine kinase [Streptomyces sp. NBC_01551]MCX4542215.1 histidine kinase [Streptomyces sp. NBC_01565]
MLDALHGEGTDGTHDGDSADDGSGPQAPRMALLVTLGVLGGHTLVTVLNVLDQDPGPGRLVLLTLCLVAVLALQFAHSTRRPRTWPVRVRVLTLAAQAVVTYLPLPWLGVPWGAMAGLLAGSVLLAVPGRLRWPLYAVVTAGIVPAVVAMAGAGIAVYGFGATLLASLIIFGVSSLSGLVAEIRETRRELAGMAVVQERLRVAGDLHDVLGYSLSAIALKTDLGHRLLPAAPDRAKSEIAEVLGIASGALADVRLVSTGYRDMSLATETESALSVLQAARIEAEADLACGPLPQKMDTVLAIVLREAVTNALRHSRARHCSVTATREGGTVSLRIRNDGVGDVSADTGLAGGSGLGNLTTRLRGVGGDLTSGPAGDGWFEVVAHAPVTCRREDRRAESDAQGAQGARDAEGAEDTAGTRDRERADGRWAPRMARSMLVAVLAGYTLITVINAAGDAASGTAVLAFLGCFAVVVVVQTLHSLRGARAWSVRARALSLGLQAAATYAPLLWLGKPWGSMAGFLAGSLLITVAGRLRLVLYAASVAVVVPLAAAVGVPLADIVYLADSSLVAGLVVYGFTALYRLVTELHEARGALARLAVARERLIVERELHEVLGSSLSEVTMKCALIHRLLPHAPEPAREELATMLELSRQALADVRLVARGYRGYRGQPDALDLSQRRRPPGSDVSPADDPPLTRQQAEAAI